MSDRGGPARSHASRQSRAIKAPVETRSYIAYVFREYARVREFGRRSHVLEAGLWPPGIRLDRRLAAFLVEQVQIWAIELSGRLAPVLENGWVHLTPRQYNLLVLLKRLCDRLSAFEFPRLNLRDRNLVDRVRRIESLFLMLHYDPETLGVILAGLRVYHEKRQEGSEQVEASQALAIRLLTEDDTLPSLFNCLVGFNILKHRRFLVLSDLMRPGLGDMVDASRFDCDSRIQERIDGYVADTLATLSQMNEQLQEARRVNRYISLDEQARPRTAALWGVYKAGETREPLDFEADQENLVLLLSRLIRGFDRTYSALLGGVCLLSHGEKASIFSRAFFELDLTRLRSLAGRLENDVFRLTRFPLRRFLRLKSNRKEAVGGEGEVADLIRETVGCLVDIGQTVSKVLALRSRPSGGPAGEEPLQPVILQGKPFVLPHENERFRPGTDLAGRTVSEALVSAVTVCFTAGMLFHDDFVSLSAGKEHKLEEDLRQQLKVIEHLILPEKRTELSAQLAGLSPDASGLARAVPG